MAQGDFRHLGGGRKGALLLFRYLFIVVASYLLVFHAAGPRASSWIGVMVATALGSNVALSLVPERHLLRSYAMASLLLGDTLWVSWALHATGAVGQDFFLLYFFLLFLAMLGESLPLLLLGAMVASAASWYLASAQELWSSAFLLRIVFFYVVPLFYSHVQSEIRTERERAESSIAWAHSLETKVAERTEVLEQLYAESLAASRLKSEFLATMSHEFRTPLNIIVGYTEILLDQGAAAAWSDNAASVRRIRKASAELLAMVDSILNFRKLEAGEMGVDSRPVSLPLFMQAFQQRARLPLAPGVALRWRIAPHLPEIATDAAKLTAVLDNLLNNAIKFTTAGSIVVSVTDCPDRGEVAFRVEDTGPGIPEAELLSIFEPFRQLDGRDDRRHGGVGLGLAIVRKYATLLAGEVSVRSALRAGTTFTLTLPYRPGAILDAGRRATRAA